MSERGKPERLDKLLSRLGYGSRRDVRHWVKQGIIQVCGELPTSPSKKVLAEDVKLENRALDHPGGLTIIYHKPLGSVCSHKEDGQLIYADFPERWSRRTPPLSSVGRLDKNTSGLLILTDDGQLNHLLTSPKQHISKSYSVTLQEPLTREEVEIFASGKLLLEDDDRPCMPAEIHLLGEKNAKLILHEGRYHQVRRMFAAIGNHVTSLTRTHIGLLSLASTELLTGRFQVVETEHLLHWVKEGKSNI